MNNLEEYKNLEGKSFKDKKAESFIREIMKISDKYGFKYSLQVLSQRNFCIIEKSSETPNRELTKESVTLEFIINYI